jgi:Fe-S cluster assembly protein SufD
MKTTIPTGQNETIVREITDNDDILEYAVCDNAQLTLVLLLAGQQNKEVSAHIRLNGIGARADILGFVVGKDDVRLALHTVQEHRAPGTTSNLLIKSVLTDAAKFFYDGGIQVAPYAQKTNAYQRNENLLLSKTASAESKPALEILANDVRCTHGATVGTVPAEQMWYLSCRGISKQEATRLIVSGFLTSALSRIADESIRHDVEEKLWQML